eukprot:584331-Prymnesium_polylepis.1
MEDFLAAASNGSQTCAPQRARAFMQGSDGARGARVAIPAYAPVTAEQIAAVLPKKDSNPRPSQRAKPEL